MTPNEELRARMIAAAFALKTTRPYSASVMSDAIGELDRLTAENKRLKEALAKRKD